jgi:hypothetical protein
MDNIQIPPQNDSARVPTIDNVWSDQEISDIVDCWSNERSFYPQIYDHLATCLAKKHSGQNRTAGELEAMVQYVRVFGY